MSEDVKEPPPEMRMAMVIGFAFVVGMLMGYWGATLMRSFGLGI